MNNAELEELAKDQEAIQQAQGLLSILPDPVPDPVTEAVMQPVIDALKQHRDILKDEDLQTAINNANAAWMTAIDTALDTSIAARQNDIDTLVGTDTTA